MTIVGNQFNVMMTIVCRTLVVGNQMMVLHGQECGTSREVPKRGGRFWSYFEKHSEEPLSVSR